MAYFNLDKQFDKILSNDLFANEEPVGNLGNNKLGKTNLYLKNNEKNVMSRDSDWKNNSLKSFDYLMSLLDSDSKLNEEDSTVKNEFDKIIDRLESLNEDIMDDYDFEDEFESDDYYDEFDELVESLDYQLDNLMEASLRKENVRKIAKENANKDSDKAARAKARVTECKEKIIQIKSRIKALKEKIKVARKPEIYREELIKAQQRLKKAQQNLKDAQIALRNANSSKRETIKSKAKKVDDKRVARNAASKERRLSTKSVK